MTHPLRDTAEKARGQLIWGPGSRPLEAPGPWVWGGAVLSDHTDSRAGRLTEEGGGAGTLPSVEGSRVKGSDFLLPLVSRSVPADSA